MYITVLFFKAIIHGYSLFLRDKGQLNPVSKNLNVASSCSTKTVTLDIDVEFT